MQPTMCELVTKRVESGFKNGAHVALDFGKENL